jgi:hypothetical protein
MVADFVDSSVALDSDVSAFMKFLREASKMPKGIRSTAAMAVTRQWYSM